MSADAPMPRHLYSCLFFFGNYSGSCFSQPNHHVTSSFPTIFFGTMMYSTMCCLTNCCWVTLSLTNDPTHTHTKTRHQHNQTHHEINTQCLHIWHMFERVSDVQFRWWTHNKIENEFHFMSAATHISHVLSSSLFCHPVSTWSFVFSCCTLLNIVMLKRRTKFLNEERHISMFSVDFLWIKKQPIWVIHWGLMVSTRRSHQAWSERLVFDNNRCLVNVVQHESPKKWLKCCHWIFALFQCQTALWLDIGLPLLCNIPLCGFWFCLLSSPRRGNTHFSHSRHIFRMFCWACIPSRKMVRAW